MKSARQRKRFADTYFLEFSRTFLHFFYQEEAFNGCYDKFCTIKWFDFCLSRTLRVILSGLINFGRWITKYIILNIIYIRLPIYLAIAGYCLTRLVNQKITMTE